MKATDSPSRVVRFGVFEADLRSGDLRKHGIRIKIREQPSQILAMLLERPGEVITREEIRSRLWPGNTFVDFDHSLNTAVMRLRDAIGDSAESPRFIETLPKRGYRFIAPVEVSPASVSENRMPTSGVPAGAAPGFNEMKGRVTPAEAFSANGAPSPAKNRAWKLSLSGAAALCTVMLGAIALYYLRSYVPSSAEAHPVKSVVVLPLENLSGDKDQEYFADGMTDALIADQAKIRSLRVISRTAAMGYKGIHKPLSEIAKDLKVDAVVEGTVLRSGNRVRITAELIRVATDQHLWVETYESTLGDVLTLQNQVASAIVNEIRISLTPEEQKRLTDTHHVNEEVYENYLKGRYYYSTHRSDQGLNKAIEYFQRATERDPKYALAYAGLANCYGIMGSTVVGTMSATEAAPKARAAALKAIDLDPGLAEAHAGMATVQFNYDWDWLGAARGFQRAIALNPSYATAYQRYSLYLMAIGHSRESIAMMNRARELEPMSPSMNFSLGWRLYLAREYAQAVEQLRNTIEMDPSFGVAHLALGQAYEQQHAYSQAIAELEKAVELSNDSTLMLAGLGQAYGTAGQRAKAEAILAQLERRSKEQYVSPFYIATVHIGLGEKDKAIRFLEKAYEDRSNGLVFIKVDPQLDSLRSDGRFQQLQRKLGLPD
jgi:TolB-like protein/DNA-binding winged helix-turn-helix (wHTH) protein/Tfp pilus assembly protein PilF